MVIRMRRALQGTELRWSENFGHFVSVGWVINNV